MQSQPPLSWKSVVLDLVAEPHRARLGQLLDALDPPSDTELSDFHKELELARARVITSKTFLHPSFVHLLGDLAGVAGVVAVLRGITLVAPRREGEPP
jgi:hypothetical protein